MSIILLTKHPLSVLWIRISPIFCTNQCTTSWSKEYQSQKTFYAHISQTIHFAHRHQLQNSLHLEYESQHSNSDCHLGRFHCRKHRFPMYSKQSKFRFRNIIFELKCKLWFEIGITLEVLFSSNVMRRKHYLCIGMNYTAIDHTTESITNIWLRNCCISGKKCPLKNCISCQKYALFVWIHCDWKPMICNSYRHSLGWINRESDVIHQHIDQYLF